MANCFQNILVYILASCFVFSSFGAYPEDHAETARTQSPLTKAILQVGPSIVQVTLVLSKYPERTRNFLEQYIDPVWQRSVCPDPCVALDYPMGTGFLVNNDGYVVTAKHVMDDLSKFKLRDKQGELDLGVQGSLVLIQMPNIGEIGPDGRAVPPGPTYRGAFSSWLYEKVAEDPIHDLALLKLKINPFTTQATLDTPTGKVNIWTVASVRFDASRPQEGEPIAVSGYPFSSPVLVTTSGAIASAWEIDRKDLPVGPPEASITHLSDLYLADMHVNPGNSGGPVFSVTDGSVIGVCVATITGAGLSFVVPAKYVIELLNKNHVKWNPGTQ